MKKLRWWQKWGQDQIARVIADLPYCEACGAFCVKSMLAIGLLPDGPPRLYYARCKPPYDYAYNGKFYKKGGEIEVDEHGQPIPKQSV